jgi:hypothetical protein
MFGPIVRWLSRGVQWEAHKSETLYTRQRRLGLCLRGHPTAKRFAAGKQWKVRTSTRGFGNGAPDGGMSYRGYIRSLSKTLRSTIGRSERRILLPPLPRSPLIARLPEFTSDEPDQACCGGASGNCWAAAMGGSLMSVPPLPSLADVKLDAIYWPSNAMLTELTPSLTESIPPDGVVCDHPIVGGALNEIFVRSRMSVGAVKPESWARSGPSPDRAQASHCLRR